MTYTYDANGNLTSTTAGQSFAWDVFNRMTSASGPGGTATYTYNGDGLKIRRIGPDGTTRYYHDGIRPIWEADGAGSMKAQLDRDIFGNLLSRKEPAGTRRYYHFDGLGSTTALSDEGGVAVATLLYDAWGNQRAATGAAVPNYRFTGAELDTASGLYHMGARFYDPTIGRWLSEDPAQDEYFDPSMLNYYSYVATNPVGNIDPDGQWLVPIIAGVFGAGFVLGAYLAVAGDDKTLAGAVGATAAGFVGGFTLGLLGQRSMEYIAASASVKEAATTVAQQTVRNIANKPGNMDHIFGQARSWHGWQALGISSQRGLQMINSAITEGMIAAGGPGSLVVGRDYRFVQYTSATLRMVLTGRWNGRYLVQVVAYWQQLTSTGQWMPYTP